MDPRLMCHFDDTGCDSPRSSHLSDEDDLQRVARLQAKKAMIVQSPVCNFEAFSHFFHLPLKAAAEKFGVRATAFKKRCRSIGIRHWPYRKVRSLKRSLQELNRCKENGILNDKQLYQFETFKKQLDKLMSPVTYGIDPSGQIMHAFVDDDDDFDSGDDMCSVGSPRYGASFSDCSISPSEMDKSSSQAFPDYPNDVHTNFDKLPPLRKPSSMNTAFQCIPRTINVPVLADMPALTLRMTSKDLSSVHGPKTAAPSAAMDSYFDRPLHMHHLDEYMDHHQGDVGDDDQVCPMVDDDIMLTDIKYEEDEAVFHDGVDYSGERFFDDVFLQISPDYGCLV
ncbi:hypothetical protein H310_01328 [Aphanomyces invadans]|uniref:RWP-RK domain-containing protein n=1 Tax=Aphanomyces invadans TaxID=157072 RepID=A0A024UQU3_9STRA|nr:hypothetical protein H310_01328 [Aphanomyces invadans]ETW08821.1 hypothetical protein H310_01328 [Aphanomyces invadans]|eukprot:XP_008862626.1 hypothetical protein H310_01328 [Aphanomyces invadans]